jgi:hypothetical protein
VIPKIYVDLGLKSGWRFLTRPAGWRMRVAGAAESLTMRNNVRRGSAAVGASMVAAFSALAVIIGPTSAADPPSDSSLIRPFPVITPTSSRWKPKFPFPYDQTKGSVTAADITAEGEMCQWYIAQYDTLTDQIDRLQFNRISANGTDWDYSVNGVQQQVDIVAGNIDKSLAFLTPRVQALTQSRNNVGDVYFPLFKGESFFKLWEQLSNVSDGIKAHQPDWFTGPSVQKAKRWGTDIHRSHVCDQ